MRNGNKCILIKPPSLPTLRYLFDLFGRGKPLSDGGLQEPGLQYAARPALRELACSLARIAPVVPGGLDLVRSESSFSSPDVAISPCIGFSAVGLGDLLIQLSPPCKLSGLGVPSKGLREDNRGWSAEMPCACRRHKDGTMVAEENPPSV